jgi:hypothetical protein
VLQTSPATGDTVVRSADGYWRNQAPGEPVGFASAIAALGGLRQEGNTARYARTNLLGNVGQLALKDEAAALKTKEANLVSIGVLPGDVITRIGVFVGGTAGGTMTHQWGALYKGEGIAEPTVLEQSADETSSAIAEKALYSWALAKPITITATNAPHAYAYAAVSVTATTVPSLLCMTATVAAGAKYLLTANSPEPSSKFSVSGTEAVAKTPTGTLTEVALTPVIVLY